MYSTGGESGTNFVWLITEDVLEEYEVLKRLRVRPNLIGKVVQLLAVRSLLDLLGWKGVVVAIGATAASVVSAYLRRVPAAALLTIGFSIGAVTMILFAFFRTYRRVSAAESSGRENSTQRAPIAETPSGPEIVVDYVYAEDDHDNHDANRPLLLKNLSATAQAFRVVTNLGIFGAGK